MTKLENTAGKSAGVKGTKTMLKKQHYWPGGLPYHIISHKQLIGLIQSLGQRQQWDHWLYGIDAYH